MVATDIEPLLEYLDDALNIYFVPQSVVNKLQIGTIHNVMIISLLVGCIMLVWIQALLLLFHIAYMHSSH